MAEQPDDIWDSSIAPWDRKRKATTITIPADDPIPEGCTVEHDNGPRRINGKPYRCLLVSFPNPSYRPKGETNP